MNARLSAALCLSLILVGGATWKRATRASVVTNLSLTAVSSEGNSAPAIADATTTDAQAPASGATSSPLTDTDLIGRQLFSDYVQLSANGQATAANLNSLAGQYADSIAGLNKAPQIVSTDLHVVPDSHAAFQAYGDKLTLIYNKYRGLIADALSQEASVSDTGPAYMKLTGNLGSLYGAEAAELEAMSVPSSLADDHLALVNIYLGNAWGYKVIGNTDTGDSATAFAGAATTNQNLTSEQSVLSGIEKILTDNGI